MIHEKKARTPEILSGWKSIARHLGMGIRTVQRYEGKMGLPIRRPAGKLRGAVLATKSELDAWVAASPIRQAFQLSDRSSHVHRGLIAVKAGVAEMHTLRQQMVALRDEVRDSMWSLNHSIEVLRADLRPSAWDAPSRSLLVSNPEARRLLEGLSMETKRRKAS